MSVDKLTVTSYRRKPGKRQSPLLSDDVVYAKELNAIYEIQPDQVILRHILSSAQEVGALKIGEAFSLSVNVDMCLTVIDEFLYINDTRRLNLLTGEVESVKNPQHVKCEYKSLINILPEFSLEDEIIEINEMASIRGITIAEVEACSCEDISLWLESEGFKHTKCDCGEDKVHNLIITDKNILITDNWSGYEEHIEYAMFNNFIMEYITCSETYYHIVYLNDSGDLCTKVVNAWCSSWDCRALTTYYFATADEFVAAIESCNSQEDEWFGDCPDKSYLPEYFMIKDIPPRNIEPEQFPTHMMYTQIIHHKQEIEVYKTPRIEYENYRYLYSGEHLYFYEIEESVDGEEFNLITLMQYDENAAPNFYTVYYIIDISPFKRADGRDPLFYMRGDIIYAIQGYMNIKTEEFTAAPNPTLDYFNNNGHDVYISFDFAQCKIGTKKLQAAGQYLINFVNIYRYPIAIESFRPIVTGNISIYEYTGASKVKIPTRTKPALRE